MMNLFNDVDDFLHSNPKEKFFDILFNTNGTVVVDELEKIIEKFVAMEKLLEEQYGDEVEKKVEEYIFSNGREIDLRKVSFYMSKMADILSKSE